MSFVTDSRTQTVSRALLVVLRVYLGVVFLVAVLAKLTASNWPANFTGFLGAVPLHHAHAFYQGFIGTVVLPNAAVFANLVRIGELLVGVSLASGTATRLGAVGAMWLVTNYMLAKGAWWWYPASNDAAFFFISLVLVLGAAGRSFGVDYFLVKRWPRAGIW